MGYYKIVSIVPMLYNNSLLLIYFMFCNLFLFIPSSYSIFSSLPFPFGSLKFVFYVCESVSVLYIDSFVLMFRFHISVISYFLLSLSELAPLSMTFSRSFHVAANGNISFFLKAE